MRDTGEMPRPSSGVPAVSAHEPAAILRTYREQARVSMTEAAQSIRRDISTISRIETGKTRPSALEVERLCQRYGRPEATDVLVQMFAVAKKRPWWYPHRNVVDGRGRLGPYVERERAARCIQMYDLRIPGLVQTEDYIRAVMAVHALPASGEEIEARVHFRLARQARLIEDPPQLDLILDESAIARMVGGPEVMAEQAVRLLEIAARPGMSVRILPFGAGAHSATDGGFTLLDQQPLPAVLGIDIPRVIVYVESLLTAQLLEEPTQVEPYRLVWAAIEKQALGTEESAGLLRRMAEGLTNP